MQSDILELGSRGGICVSCFHMSQEESCLAGLGSSNQSTKAGSHHEGGGGWKYPGAGSGAREMTKI